LFLGFILSFLLIVNFMAFFKPLGQVRNP
jgi:hypothetical protein